MCHFQMERIAQELELDDSKAVSTKQIKKVAVSAPGAHFKVAKASKRSGLVPAKTKIIMRRKKYVTRIKKSAPD